MDIMYRFWPPKFEQREIQGPGPSGVHQVVKGSIRHPYCRVFKLKKSKKRKIRIFEKTGFPGYGSGLGDSGPSGGDPEVPRDQ